MALLCLNFKAQAQDNKAVDVTLKGIQIGQKVPDISITNLHNYKDASGNPASTAKLSDFKGKLLILDFWATWCSPCVAMIPKMDSLQKAFGDKIQFLSVTYQKDNEVLPFTENLEKRLGKRFSLPMINGDTELGKLFPHVYLPHYVWIDGNGVVKGITGQEDISAVNIREQLTSGAPLSKKTDMKVSYDLKLPLLLNSNGGDGSNMVYHSLLTNFSPGLAGGYTFDRLDTTFVKPRKISCWNKSVSQLFKIAFQTDTTNLPNNRMLFEVAAPEKLKSPAPGAVFTEWRKTNTYCYELVVPPVMARGMYKMMQDDLVRLFPQYHARFEKRKVRALVMIRTSSEDKLKTIGGKPFASVNATSYRSGNAGLDYFFTQLNMFYLSKHPIPILDATGYHGKVDLNIVANLSNIGEINKALAKYDLSFIERDVEVEMLVVRDVNKFAAKL